MDLTQGNIRGHLSQLAIPSSVAFFFATMLYVVDTYFAGKISTEAQAALSITFPVYFIIIAVIQGVSIGSQTLIANALGEGRDDEALLLCKQALSFGGIVSLFLTAFGYFFTEKILRLIGADGFVLQYASAYMEWIFLASFFLILTNTSNAILMAYGIARPFRNWLITAFLLHLIGDPWFIYGGLGVPPLGFFGIVYATAITMVIGFFFMMFCLFESRLLKGGTFQDFIPKKNLFFPLLNQGLPACMNMMSIALGLLLITGFVLYFGKNAAAAYGIGIRIQQLFLLPTLGLSIGALAIIGQNNGAGKIERVQECIKDSLFFGFLIVLCGFIPMFTFPEFLIQAFSSDSKVIAIGSTFLRISAFTCFAFVAIMIFTSALQGMKYPLTALVIGFGRQVLMPFILLPLLFTWMHMTLESIWLMLLGVNAIFAGIAFFLTKRVIDKRMKENRDL